MHTMNDEEARIRWLEVAVNQLQARLKAAMDKLGQVAEDNERKNEDTGIGRVLIRGQSVGVIAARTTNTPGTGTFRFLQVIAGAEYLLQPFAMGDVTAPCVNDTGSPTINNEYLVLAMVDGLWTCIVGDCVTATPARAPDPP